MFYDGYSSVEQAGTGIGIWVLFFYFAVVLFCIIVALIGYILKGLGIYTMARRLGIHYAWLAFIPLGRRYLQGQLSGPITLKKRTLQNPGACLLALPLIRGAVLVIMYLLFAFLGLGISAQVLYGTRRNPSMLTIRSGVVTGWIVVAVLILLILVAYFVGYRVLKALVNNQIFRQFTTPNMALVHAILSEVIPLYETICFFVMRKRPFLTAESSDGEEGSRTETGSDSEKKSEPDRDNLPPRGLWEGRSPKEDAAPPEEESGDKPEEEPESEEE